jgi:hypothetical protein
MITNEFFKGYHQALNTVEDNVLHLINIYENKYNESSRHTDIEIEKILEALDSVKLHINQLRRSYKELQRQLVNEQKKE